MAWTWRSWAAKSVQEVWLAMVCSWALWAGLWRWLMWRRDELGFGLSVRSSSGSCAAGHCKMVWCRPLLALGLHSNIREVLNI
ncbi:hypothetical protein Taro_049244 [Colocasia esculenta]|uniref:Uncharacterized protein n=1 Tax=Colocasia esculenta TaxID=4460 RepID=A0A843XAA9_COLES|nr:hypothetical protein [Colocasia esculenta]